MESLGGISDTTADYGRLAALPVAQGPASITRLANWLETARATVAPLVWSYPDEEPLDPGGAMERRARGVDIGGGEAVLIPTDTPARIIENANTAGDVAVLVGDADWSDVTLERLSMQGGETPAQFAVRVAGRLVWDAAAADASPLPLPFHPDESLAISYGIAGDPSGMIGAALPGALTDDPPDPPHLLATTTQTTGGEVDGQLIRAPATGLIRFDRYQHLVRADDGRIALRRPSNDGRLVLRSSPLTDVDPFAADAFDADTRIDDAQWIVFEDVETATLIEVLPPLLLDQLRRIGTLTERWPFVADAGGLGRSLRLTAAWLLRSWQAVAALDGELARVPAAVAAELRALVPAGWLPDGPAGDEQLVAAAALATGDPEAWFALTSFASDLFAPIAAGDGWSDVGVPVSMMDALGASEEADELIALARTFDRWLPCFAGCPLGRLGRRWVLEDEVPIVWDEAGERFPDAAAAHRASFSTFHVEALYQARFGGSGDSVRDHAQARAQGPVVDFALVDYGENTLGGRRLGRAGTLRIAEPDHPKRGFTTLDWIRELACGTTRMRTQLALADMQPACDAGHPLAAAIDWRQYRVGRILRDRMDVLAAQRVRVTGADPDGVALQDALAGWWVGETKLADGAGRWPKPFLDDTGHLQRGPATPPAPYRRAGSASTGRDRAVTQGRRLLRHAPEKLRILWNVGESGWDDFDVAAAVRAAQVVRDGRTLQGPVHPALVLAVAETEGYRLFTGQNRIPSSRFEMVLGLAAALPADFQPGSARTGEFTDSVARAQWQVWTFGMDILNAARRGDAPSMTTVTFIEDADAQVEWALGRLANVDWAGGPMEAPVPPVAPDRSILAPDFLASGAVTRFVKSRLSSAWTRVGGFDTVGFSRVSRRLEWVGLALQAAVFQWHHRQISEGRGYLFDMLFDPNRPGVNAEAIDHVAELADQPAPDPGPDALSDERRRYIAYWSTVYLTFNASVAILNHWLRTAQPGAAAAGRPVTEQLLYKLDSSGSADARARVLGNMTRFALALEAYLRLDYDVDPLAPGPDAAGVDVSDPDLRAW